jgi:hypothetical protein
MRIEGPDLYLIARSLEDATSCCACQRCGARLDGERRCHGTCATCPPVDATPFDLRIQLAEKNFARELQLIEDSLMAARDREAAETLSDLMHDISEEHTCARWNTGLEFHLWGIVNGGDLSYGIALLTEDKRERLRTLSEQAGGWWWWPDGSLTDVFVVLAEWKQIYSAYIAGTRSHT